MIVIVRRVGTTTNRGCVAPTGLLWRTTNLGSQRFTLGYRLDPSGAGEARDTSATFATSIRNQSFRLSLG